MAIRKLVLVGLVVLYLAFPFEVFAGGDFKSGSEPDGFRGIKWGTKFSTLKGMEMVEDAGLNKLYKRNGDEMNIGAAQVIKIFYGFWNGEFSVVQTISKDFINYQHLKAAVFEKFGNGRRSEAKERLDIEDYFWEGSLTTMNLKFDNIRDEGRLLLWSKEIDRKKESWEQQKAREGAKGGF